MATELYTRLQTELKRLGLYKSTIDGNWGPGSHAAFCTAREMVRGGKAGDMNAELTGYCKAVAWSAKVTPAFITRLKDITARLGMRTPDEMISCMAFETGETFSPTIKNGAGAPYYGLIQFGAAAAKDAGTTLEALLKMTAEQQLDYVYNFFKPYANRLQTLSDVYSRIIWPVAVGKPEDYKIFTQGTTAYLQNRGLDINKDGFITKAECAAKVQEKYVRGLDPANLRP